MKYQDALDWLYSTQNFGIKLGLEQPTRLLLSLDVFPKKSTQVIHVAGTNGKGSTCALIDSIARTSGLRTGLFTSPHLIDYRERIQVSGHMIPEENVAESLTELRELVKNWENHPTFFELTLAVAMKYFVTSECELLILETGMGGRFDATTAIPADVAVITPIDLDHTQWLGETLTAIASEKAGIIVEQKPTLSAPQQNEALLVLREQAMKQRSELTIVSQSLEGFHLGIPGSHQKMNAALAVESLLAAGYELRNDSIREGLSQARWPGRFEIFDVNGQTIVLDGAHNPHAAQSLIETWQEQYPQQQATLIFGAVESKDITGVLEKISQISSEIRFVPVNSVRAIPPEQLLEAASSLDTAKTLHPDLDTALNLPTKGPLLISGSLFLVGEARSFLLNKKFQASAQ